MSPSMCCVCVCFKLHTEFPSKWSSSFLFFFFFFPFMVLMFAAPNLKKVEGTLSLSLKRVLAKVLSLHEECLNFELGL